MMTDKELLELAAKAAGIEFHNDNYNDLSGMWIKCEPIPGVYPTHFTSWHPLADDGDALRLAVKLGLDLQVFNGSKNTTAVERDTFSEHREYHGDNPYAATRRAIVRAAAEIGMKQNA